MLASRDGSEQARPGFVQFLQGNWVTFDGPTPPKPKPAVRGLNLNQERHSP